jgi:hypothetical protein
MTPAIHWSARGMFDQMHTLWGGYHVRTGGEGRGQASLSFWFAGEPPQPEVLKRVRASILLILTTPMSSVVVAPAPSLSTAVQQLLSRL